MKQKKIEERRQCLETLQLLDYLRKSQCTPVISFWRDGAQPKKDLECRRTLRDMEEVAKECLKSTTAKL